MLIEHMAECHFCGQLIAIDAKTALDESERLEEAKRRCACEGASRWRLQQEVYEKIDNVFGAGAMEHGFDCAETEGVLAEIKHAADAIIDKRIRRCKLVTAGGDCVELISEPGDVKVKRASKKQIAI